MKIDGNRENPCVTTTDGQKVWVSRSVAVIMHVVIEFNYELFVIATKRGSKAHNNNGQWCLPCGFLDWDESGAQAATRELFEETSINVANFGHHTNKIKYEGLTADFPWKVVTDPKSDAMQNVCLHYGILVKKSSSPFSMACTDYTNDETEKVDIIPVNEFINMKNVAFGHNNRLDQFLCFLKANRYL